MSTSLLSFSRDIGKRKTRVVAKWLEDRGFESIIEERLLGDRTGRTTSEPGVALCGVDTAEARAALEKAGFGLVVEAGLGAGPDSFRSIGLHTFPASSAASMDECGPVQLASRTIAVPFVGLIAGCLVISEVLRRLHGGPRAEVLSVSTLSLGDAELVPAADTSPYAFGFVETAATVA